jgi:hypothetical protein
MGGESFRSEKATKHSLDTGAVAGSELAPRTNDPGLPPTTRPPPRALYRGDPILRAMGDSLAEAGLLGPGLVRRTAQRVHLSVPRLGWRARAVLFGLVTWVPLAFLTAAEGTFMGTGWTFSRDLGAYARFLLAGPLLVAMEPWIDRQLSSAIVEWRTSELVPPDRQPVFDRFLARVHRWRSSSQPEVILLVLAYGLTLVGLAAKTRRVAEPWLFGGDAPGRLSWAGWWWLLVAGPLFLHLCLRWLWRFAVWTASLLRLATLPLRLFGTHADCMGGLLGVVKHHHVFTLVPLALSMVATGASANTIFHRGRTLAELRQQEIFFAAILLVIFVGPLLVFTPLLVRARRVAADRYGAVAAHHAAHLEDQIDAALAVDQRTRPRLSDDLLESEANLAQSFDGLLKMSAFPVTRSSLLMFAAATVGPLLLLELTAVPARELLLGVKELLL